MKSNLAEVSCSMSQVGSARPVVVAGGDSGNEKSGISGGNTLGKLRCCSPHSSVCLSAKMDSRLVAPFADGEDPNNSGEGADSSRSPEAALGNGDRRRPPPDAVPVNVEVNEAEVRGGAADVPRSGAKTLCAEDAAATAAAAAGKKNEEDLRSEQCGGAEMFVTERKPAADETAVAISFCSFDLRGPRSC
jgi:hypothetical protein